MHMEDVLGELPTEIMRGWSMRKKKRSRIDPRVLGYRLDE